ncbi:MAG: Crp/Fnr family transcriptional regulator [Burkholderiales bacterium]|nr:Crp/Fnr family transcriptional regulator [Burkholderiales bacterium]
MKCALYDHPLRNSISLQLRANPLLAALDATAQAELFAMLEVLDVPRGETLLQQGGRELRQFFVIEGMLKRVVTSAGGREMTLHFAREGDFETAYDAWRSRCGSAYAVVCARRAVLATLAMDDWCSFMDRHPAARQAFHDRMLQLGSAIADHAVALLLLDAPSRVDRFSCRYPDLAESLSQRDVAAHLNLSAETLCRLSRRQRAQVAA